MTEIWDVKFMIDILILIHWITKQGYGHRDERMNESLNK